MVEKMCYNPLILFDVEKRSYIREYYFANVVLLDLNNPWTVTKENIAYKCVWSPIEGNTFHSNISHTFVSGHLANKNANFPNKEMQND
jgi:dihydroorotase